MLYELITANEPVTFKAVNDKVAFACALMVGSGRAGCLNIETGRHLPCLLLFNPNPDEAIKEYLGVDAKKFFEDNKALIVDSLNSFAYGKASDRIIYDTALESITDINKMNEFMERYEDAQSKYIPQYVKYAWSLAKELR